MNSSPKLGIAGFHFGVEIEFNVDVDDVERYIAFNDGWAFHEEHCGTEVVSPRLKGYAGLMSVRRMLRNIHGGIRDMGKNDISLNDAGLHVHVDIQDFTLGNAKRLIHLAHRFDDVMFGIMDGSRFDNRYTRHIVCSEKEINACVTIADLQRLQTDERYSCINMYAFPKHGTVEFRYAGATIDWRRVYSLISLYLRMVAFAQSHEPIPSRSRDTWVSPGLKYGKKQMAGKESGKQILFDALQLKGGVKRILDGLFSQNKSKKTKASRKEKVSKKLYPTGLRSK